MAVSHIYGSRFNSLNMVNMLDVTNSALKDTGIASLMNSNESQDRVHIS